jgi:hypothetical protein
MHGIAGCGKTACPVVTEGLTLATGPFYSLLNLLIIKDGTGTAMQLAFCRACGAAFPLDAARENAKRLLEIFDSSDPHLAEKLRCI